MKTWTRALMFCGLFASACGHAPTTASRTEASPTPPTIPFATVAPIIASACSPCHSTTFVNNQDQVYAERTAIADYLTRKIMPPAYAPTPLNDADRALLIRYAKQFP